VKISVFAELAGKGTQVHIESFSNLLGSLVGRVSLAGEDHGDSGWADSDAEGYGAYVDELAAEQHSMRSGPRFYAALRLVIFTFCILRGHVVLWGDSQLLLLTGPIRMAQV
jgi:hypothetical protein